MMLESDRIRLVISEIEEAAREIKKLQGSTQA